MKRGARLIAFLHRGAAEVNQCPKWGEQAVLLMWHICQLIAVAIQNKELPFTLFAFFFAVLMFLHLCSPSPLLSYYFGLLMSLILDSFYLLFMPCKQAPKRFLWCFSAVSGC